MSVGPAAAGEEERGHRNDPFVSVHCVRREWRWGKKEREIELEGVSWKEDVLCIITFTLSIFSNDHLQSVSQEERKQQLIVIA